MVSVMIKTSNRCRPLLLALLFTAIFSVPVAAQAVVLKIATVSPEGATWMVKMREAAEEISKATANRVTFKFYSGGVMGDDQSVLRKIRIGQLHGGAVTGGSMATIYPDSQLYNLPFLFNSLDEVDYVRKKLDSVLMAGIEKSGFVTFGFAEGGFAYLMSSSSITDLETLRKQKVWVPTNDITGQTVFKEGNIPAVPLPLSDVMTGLQTGLINTVGTSPIAAIALQWHTKTSHLIHMPLSYFYAMLAIDKKVYNRISVADRKLMRDIMEKTFKDIDRQNRKDNDGAFKALQNQGIKIINLTDKEERRWKDIGTRASAEIKKGNVFSSTNWNTLHNALETYRKQSAKH